MTYLFLRERHRNIEDTQKNVSDDSDYITWRLKMVDSASFP